MPEVLMVHVPLEGWENLQRGISRGRWAFPAGVPSADLASLTAGHLMFLGYGGRPRVGGGFPAWQGRTLSEAHLVRVTREPFENEEPFWVDEERDGVVRWNPTVEVEYLDALGPVPLAAGSALTLAGTDALYRGAVSHRLRRVPDADLLLLTGRSYATLAPVAPARPRAAAGPSRPRGGGGGGASVVRLVAVERRMTGRAPVRGRPATHADRVESELLHGYVDHLAAGGDVLRRLAIPIPTGVMCSDLVDVTRGTLVEAKGAATRANVRTAIGQVLDYGRFWKAEVRAVLLPEPPDDDLLRLLASVRVECVWRDGDGFADTVDGVLT